MRKLFLQALTVMGNAFRRLENQVAPPKMRPFKDGFVFRYIEQTPLQAIIQKLARVISALHAVDLLLMHGFVQEQGVLHRTLDELNEDLIFLAAALTNDTITDLHSQYLEAFYKEEFDVPHDPIASTQKRNSPTRKKIRAYISRVLGESTNQSRDAALGETVSKAYSGFVHGASPHIMDMCGGMPPKFYLNGMLGTIRIAEHADDAWNYFYRSLISVNVAARAFGDNSLVDALNEYIDKFEAASETNFSKQPNVNSG